MIEITVTLRHQAPGSTNWTGYSVRISDPDRPTMNVLISVLDVPSRSGDRIREMLPDDLHRLGEALLDAASNPSSIRWG